MFRLRQSVYLDNNATTTVSQGVRKKINYVLKYCYGNPSSLYRAARDSAVVLEESRELVAAAVNAEPREIFFTGSASEANNTVLKSMVESSFPEKKKIISTPIEHASIMTTLDYLTEKGVIVEYYPVDERGRAKPDELEKMLDDDTFLLCCILANNETGTIQDINKITELAHKKGVRVMADCVQALGKIPVDVKAMGIEYASFSAHKIHGPKGVGALYVRDGECISPLIHGGHQEQGIRAGTESLHNIAGFGQACKEIDACLEQSQHILQLKNEFIAGLKELKPDLKIHSPTAADECLPNTVNISFPGVSNAVFMAFLDYNGISVSAGSACNTQEDAPSHVLKSIGLSDDEARESLRFSLGTDITGKKIKYALKIVKEFLKGGKSPINIVKPGQLNENMLNNEQTYILDIRFWYDRRLMESLPNSHEATFYKFHKFLDLIPRNKNILVVCQAGYYSPMVAYYLKSKHFKNVGFLLGGLVGWRMSHKELYKKTAGQNITRLSPGKK